MISSVQKWPQNFRWSIESCTPQKSFLWTVRWRGIASEAKSCFHQSPHSLGRKSYRKKNLVGFWHHLKSMIVKMIPVKVWKTKVLLIKPPIRSYAQNRPSARIQLTKLLLPWKKWRRSGNQTYRYEISPVSIGTSSINGWCSSFPWLPGSIMNWHRTAFLLATALSSFSISFSSCDKTWSWREPFPAARGIHLVEANDKYGQCRMSWYTSSR